MTDESHCGKCGSACEGCRAGKCPGGDGGAGAGGAGESGAGASGAGEGGAGASGAGASSVSAADSGISGRFSPAPIAEIGSVPAGCDANTLPHMLARCEARGRHATIALRA